MAAKPDRAARKGARRIAEIPAEVLQGLNHGRLETVNLVEWLAIDSLTLLERVLAELNLGARAREVLDRAGPLADAGIMARTTGIAAALAGGLAGHPRRTTILKRLSQHPSDTVRAWAANIVAASDPGMPLQARLDQIRPFAADRHFGVRECAWMAVRPFLASELTRAVRFLKSWVKDTDPNIRRFAVEGTRPRGVWCAHVRALREKPELAASLLEPVRADTSRYVQLSVANWLNDASKTRPDWVVATCDRWLVESPRVETVWIIDHALRTLKKAHPLPAHLAPPARKGRARS